MFGGSRKAVTVLTTELHQQAVKEQKSISVGFKLWFHVSHTLFIVIRVRTV